MALPFRITASSVIAYMGIALCGFAQAQSLLSTGVRAVPTYEAVGLYWSSPGAGSAGCNVQYRQVGDATWRQGLAMWFDSAANECRGSLVSLTPGTAYEAQMGVGGTYTHGTTFTTWSNTVPVAQTIKVPSGTATLDITTGGTATGYVVYDGTGATLDAQNGSPTNINVNASYVIVRGFTLRGAQQHGILIDRNQHDVIIEDNDIAGWGRTRDGTWGTDMDSGIRAICVNEELTRVTIQRNRIHDPRYGANSWSVAHPAGPQGITFSYCGGNNVYRWNEVYSTNGNHYNDPIGGEDNFSTSGFPNRDSDIYGNIFANSWDDGIEADGGNSNVRIWGNYIDYTGGSAISTTLNSVGPVYIFRNVWNHNQFYANLASPDLDSRGVFAKSGSSSGFGNGRRYIFHNTMLQATQAGAQYGLGGAAGIGGTGSAQLTMNTISMNNIWQVWKPANGAFYQIGPDGVFQNDMTNAASPPEAGNIIATPQYAAGNGAQSGSGGLYQLAAGTPGHDQGTRIANFNDGFLGAAPDVGAAEAGAPAMKFGLAAATSGSSAGGAGTTTTTPGGGTTGGSTGTTTRTGTAPVSAAMDSSAYSFNAGTSVTLTAALMGNSGTPTGSVTFKDSGVSIAGCAGVPVSGGKAICTTSGFAGGSHPVTGAYSGDSTYGAGVAGPITLTVAGSVAAAPAPATNASTLITHYYQAILHRAPDPSGASYWESQVTQMQSIGADVNEVFYAMAMSFFASGEYAALGRDNNGYVTDLYNAFFNRAPDAGGLAYWSGQVASGMPRDVALLSFMFSPEFTAYVQGMLGSTAVRMEIDTVMDFYRGVLARLPDGSGFSFWLQQFRTAQCQGTGAVYTQVQSVTSAFLYSAEYAGRGRTNAQFVGDMYNALLRRGGDLAGVQFWIGQLDSGAATRDGVLRAFIGSPEFTNRVNAVVAQGCAG